MDEMTLAEVRDFVLSLGTHDAAHVYMGKLDAKPDSSVGVYNSKQRYPYSIPIGGEACRRHRIKNVTLLCHGTRSAQGTETAARALWNAVISARNVAVNEMTTIRFIQPNYDLQDVGTDEGGVYEYVMELAVVYEKEAKNG